MKYEADSGSLSLVNLHFEVFPLEHNEEPDLEFKINAEVSDVNAERFPVLWDVSLIFCPLFSLSARYEMHVLNIETGSLDKKTLLGEASYPILAEFSMLISSLTKSVGVIPLVMSPSELRELASIDE